MFPYTEASKFIRSCDHVCWVWFETALRILMLGLVYLRVRTITLKVSEGVPNRTFPSLPPPLDTKSHSSENTIHSQILLHQGKNMEFKLAFRITPFRECYDNYFGIRSLKGLMLHFH